MLFTVLLNESKSGLEGYQLLADENNNPNVQGVTWQLFPLPGLP